jgi:hypothetical protein
VLAEHLSFNPLLLTPINIIYEKNPHVDRHIVVYIFNTLLAVNSQPFDMFGSFSTFLLTRLTLYDSHGNT